MMLDVRVEEVEAVCVALQELVGRVARLEEKVLGFRAWYSREELAGLKGVKVSTFYNKPWLLPGPASRQGGNERWSHAQVWDSGWIWKSDADLQPKGARRGHD